MITIDTFKTIIKENQELIASVELCSRPLHLEEAGRYVFVGIRQAGKSYMLYQRAHELMAQGYTIDEILYVDFDDERLLAMSADDLDTILQAYSVLYDRQPICMFDEIQNIQGWEHFVRRLANKKYRVFVTGSNAKMLSRDIQTTLGGRYIEKNVYPYTFSEWLTAQGIQLDKNWQYGKQHTLVQKRIEEYFCWGGFPELLMYREKRQWLNSLYEKILLGDVIQRNGIKNEKALRLAMMRLAENVKQPVAYNRIANLVKATGVNTNTASVIQYLGFVRDACLMFSLDNYASKFVEKETVKKHYFMDNGLLSIFLTDVMTYLLENMVAIRMYQQYKEGLYYYNQNIEVDFYVPEQSLAIQACYSLHSGENVEATYERETKALVQFNKLYPCSQNLIVTYDEEETIVRDGLTIEVVPLWKWLV